MGSNTITNILQNLTVNEKSVDGVVGIRTLDKGLLAAEESTEL